MKDLEEITHEIVEGKLRHVLLKTVESTSKKPEEIDGFEFVEKQNTYQDGYLGCNVYTFLYKKYLD